MTTTCEDWDAGVVFTHALALVLDPRAQRWFDLVRAELSGAGVPVLHQPAHLTLACVDTMAGVEQCVRSVRWPARVRLTSACLLPNSDGVVSACPHPGDGRTSAAPPTGEGRTGPCATAVGEEPGEAGEATAPRVPEDLAAPHRLLHDRLARAGVRTFCYYGPRLWHPHLTVGYQAEPRQRRLGATLLSRHLPVELSVEGVGAWDVAHDTVEMVG